MFLLKIKIIVKVKCNCTIYAYLKVKIWKNGWFKQVIDKGIALSELVLRLFFIIG